MANLQNDIIEAEPHLSDGKSTFSAPLTSSLTSLRSTVLEYKEENGRIYHSMKYAFPNDSTETERLNLQSYVWLVTLRGELCLSPKKDGAKRVLDVGTGTGVWAIDYADAHPEAQVIGVDLSRMQPSLAPPNCSFEVDDVEKDWAWDKPFDFIFGRVLAGCFSDYQAFIDKAFAALEPGGYLELQDVYTPWTSDDGTLSEDSSMYKIGAECGEASRILGRPLDQCAKYKEYLANAGFVDIVERKFKWPLGVWPRDKYYKDIGQLYFDNIEANLEGLSMALLHRALGWTAAEVQTLCAGAREELRLGFIHAYTPVYVVYGRKPDADKSSQT